MKKFLIITVLISLGIMPQLFSQESKYQIPPKSYEENWSSLAKYPNAKWFRDAKFGIYFHWGVYSVPAWGGEWYPHWMYLDTLGWGSDYYNHHKNTYGSQATFGYKDFIPSFTAEYFDANEWVDLFVKAGAKFVGPVAEHADGFSMWNSKINKWNAAKMGPKRDIVGEMAVATHKRDLKFITTFHHQWLWAWYPTWDTTMDCSNPEYAGLYGPKVTPDEFDDPQPSKAFNQLWYTKIKEVIDQYEPDLIWLDSRMYTISDIYRRRFLAYYYNKAKDWNKEVVMTYKAEDFPVNTGILDIERGQMSDLKSFPWLVDTSIDKNTWCDVENPSYKTAGELIDYLVDVVSKNGQLLLNIPPKANGQIPEKVRSILLEIGEWLNINGEAIYGTRPWTIYGEGPIVVPEGGFSDNDITTFTDKDIRFTTKGDTLYAIALGEPSRELLIKSLPKSKYQIDAVVMLGSNETLKFTQNVDGARVSLPSKIPSACALALRITGRQK
jgi:alpha-L-fucosidase